MDTMIKTGAPAPDFRLPDLSGNIYHLRDFKGIIVVINFWSAECPWSERSDSELIRLLPLWGDRVKLLTIASNANEPLELIQKAAKQRGLPVVLHDRQQIVADLYGAQTTPHIFVIDSNGILRYQGAFDDVTFRQKFPTRNYLSEAIEALLNGVQPKVREAPPYGCTIIQHFE